jgi:hypothetical protein
MRIGFKTQKMLWEERMNITKKELIGWASQGIEYVKTGFDHVVKQVEEKLKDQAMEDNECYQSAKSQVGSPAAARDVCEFKERIDQMWVEEAAEKPQTLADYVRLMKKNVEEINELYKGLLDKASDIDGKARVERKALEKLIKSQSETLENYRYFVKQKADIKHIWSVDSEIEEKVTDMKNRALRLKDKAEREKRFEEEKKAAAEVGVMTKDDLVKALKSNPYITKPEETKENVD